MYDDEMIGGAPMKRNPYVIGAVLFVAVAGLVLLALWLTGVIEFFEGFRAWNACEMRDMIPFAYNSCDRKALMKDGAPVPVGESYKMKDESKKDMLNDVNPEDLPNLGDLQNYAKNMWDSVISSSDPMDLGQAVRPHRK